MNVYRDKEFYEKQEYQKKYQRMYVNKKVDHEKKPQIGRDFTHTVATE